MNIQKTYLKSLIDILPNSLQERISTFYQLEGATNDEILEQAQKLVYFNDNFGDGSLQNILTVIAKGQHEPIPYDRILTTKMDSQLSTKSGHSGSIETIIEKLLSKNLGINEFADKLFHALRFYYNFTPSSGIPSSVSYFEYIKSSAAFCHCLLNADQKEHPFLIVCGDVSGIQRFIYDIHNSRAYKSIKGRSYYLTLLIESLLSKILISTNSPRTNVIYSGAGKFYLLLPNNAQNVQFLTSFEEQLQSQLFKEFQLGLYVCLAWIPFNIGSYYQITTPEKKLVGENIEGIGDLWAAISEKAAKRKSRKYLTILKENFSEVFSGQLEEEYNGEQTAICAVSGLPIPKTKDNILSADDDEPIYVHPLVKQQVTLGAALQESNTIVEKRNKQTSAKQIEPLQLGISYSVSTDYSKGDRIILMNPEDEEQYLNFFEKTGSTEFTFYGGNLQAVDVDNNLKTLEEIAKPGPESSMHKIAVMKMDVDNLGRVFSSGMGQAYGTFAAFSDLSARLDWFFSGFINTMRNNELYKDYINVLYSGGDDVCIVGKWDKVINFSTELRKHFRAYVGNSDQLSLSAGIGIFGPKFPISKAISIADDALDEAKKYKGWLNGGLVAEEPTKNAIHILGLSVDWGHSSEWDFVIALKQLLLEWLVEEKLSKGVVHKLYLYNTLREKEDQSWRWRSAYYFARMNTEEGRKIQTAILTGTFEHRTVGFKTTPTRMFELINLALKLADYQLR